MKNENKEYLLQSMEILKERSEWIKINSINNKWRSHGSKIGQMITIRNRQTVVYQRFLIVFFMNHTILLFIFIYFLYLFAINWFFGKPITIFLKTWSKI